MVEASGSEFTRESGRPGAGSFAQFICSWWQLWPPRHRHLSHLPRLQFAAVFKIRVASSATRHWTRTSIFSAPVVSEISASIHPLHSIHYLDCKQLFWQHQQSRKAATSLERLVRLKSALQIVVHTSTTSIVYESNGSTRHKGSPAGRECPWTATERLKSS